MYPGWDSSGQSIIPVLGASAAAWGGHWVTTSSAKQESRWLLLALGSPAPCVPRPTHVHWHMGSALAALPWEIHSKSTTCHPLRVLDCESLGLVSAQGSHHHCCCHHWLHFPGLSSWPHSTGTQPSPGTCGCA